MYFLQKLKIKKGERSAVRAGLYCFSEVGHYRRGDEDEDDMIVLDLDEVEVGGMLLVYNDFCDLIKTSQVTKLLNRGEDFVKFETGTSVYFLRELKDE